MSIWREVPGHILIGTDGTGQLQFGLVSSELDGRLEQCGDTSRFEFSWSGQDENEPVCGRDWTVMRKKGTEEKGDGTIYLQIPDTRKEEERAMNITAEKIITDAMELPPTLRAFIAEKLLESLDEPDGLPLSTQWKEEIQRRCAEIDQDAGRLRNADAVFNKAYASLT